MNENLPGNISIHDVVSSMLEHIDRAIASDEPDMIRKHLRQAMSAGEDLELEVAGEASKSEEHETTDDLEEGLEYLRRFFQLGVEALAGDPEFLEDRVREMRTLAIRAAEHVGEASIPLGGA